MFIGVRVPIAFETVVENYNVAQLLCRFIPAIMRWGGYISMMASTTDAMQL